MGEMMPCLCKKCTEEYREYEIQQEDFERRQEQEFAEWLDNEEFKRKVKK